MPGKGDELLTKQIEKIKAYATEFIGGYSEALDKNYTNVTWKIREMGFGSAFLPLYRREPGRDVALAVLSTENDFYIYFIEEQDKLIKVFTVAGDAEGFDIEWTSNTPDDKRSERVKDHLGITDSTTLEQVNAPGGVSFLSFDASYIANQGRQHGNTFGNRAGKKAEQALPNLLAKENGSSWIF